MLPRRLLLLLCAFGATAALARARMIPIKSSFIGAAASSSPASFLRAGSKVFFSANDGTHGMEPWVTDGTSEGTTLVADLNPGSDGSAPVMIGSIGSLAIFTAYESSTINSLWRSDGTPAGTTKLATIPMAPGTADLGWAITTVAADTRVFVLVRQVYNGPFEIIATDGTPAGTQDLGSFPINRGPLGVNGNLYFAETDAIVGPQLWVSDGTVFGAHMVDRDEECPGAYCAPAPLSFFRMGATVCFVTGSGLWKTDGSAAGTQQFASISNVTLLASSPTSAIAYLINSDGIVWKTDGTAAGTTLAGSITKPFQQSVLDDGRLIYLHYSGALYEVWISDGTDAGTVKLGAFSANYPAQVLGVFGNRVLFEGGDDASGQELWAADPGAGTLSLVKDIDARADVNGPFSSNPGPGASLGASFLFPATDLAGRELWRTDGTAAGTRMLANIAPDPGGGVVSGTVRASADGTPVTTTGVYLCTPAGTSCDSTLTDASGHYHFDGVIPGTYSVAAVGYFYVSQFYDGLNYPVPSGTATPVTVSSGFETSGVDFSLIRGGTMSGTVKRASTGQPLFSEVLIRNTSGRVVDDQFTDNSGRYQSRGLMTGTYYAETVNHPYFDPRPAINQVYHNHDCLPPGCDWHVGDGISLTNAIDTTGIDFSLHELGTIAGTVRDDTSTPLSGLTVYFIPQGSTSPSIWVTTDVNGSYLSPLLNPGSYYVVTGGVRGFDTIVYPNGTCSNAFNCSPAGGTLVALSVDGAATGIDIQLTFPQSRLTGTIRDLNGAPFAGITVQLLDIHASSVGAVTTGINGQYEFSSTPAGTYYLFAIDEVYPGVDCFTGPCSLTGATPLVATNGHTTRADMQLRSQWTTISGHLLDAVSGQPIPGSGSIELLNSAGHGIANGITLNGGSYQIAGASRDTAFYLAAFEYGYHGAVYKNMTWDCGTSGCPPLPAGATPIPAGTHTNIDVVMQRTGSISGTVTDAATGKPLPTAEFLLYQPGGAYAYTNALTDANGHYQVSVPPGSYTAYATPYTSIAYQPQLYRNRNCPTTCDPSKGDVINVTDGVETSGIDFHLGLSTPSGTISGHVLDAATGLPMAGAYVSVSSGGAATTDAQGFYSLAGGLPTGQYKMYAEAPQPYFIGLSGGGNCADYSCFGNGTPVQVTVPNTTTVDFRLIKLRITSVSPAYGPAAGGTRITISGANFTSLATVTIGGSAAVVVSVTPTQIVAITPPSASGPAHVTVNIQSLADTFVQGFLYLPATTFTDDPLVAGATLIKAVHILELRTAVNRWRAAAALPNFSFTDPAVPGSLIKAIDIVELRTALDQARATLGLPSLSYTHTITPGVAILAIDVAEIRNGVR